MSDFFADEELIQEFVIESREALSTVDESLLALEEDPSQTQLVAEIFRRVHTIKGSAGFLDIENLEVLAHAGESLLSDVRDETTPFTEPIATALMETVDALRDGLDRCETQGLDSVLPYAALIARLRALRETRGASTELPGADAPAPTETDEGETPTEVAPEATAADPAPEAEAAAEAPEPAIETAHTEPQPPVEPAAETAEPQPPVEPAAETPTATTAPPAPIDLAPEQMSNLVGQVLVVNGVINQDQLSRALARQQAGDTRRIGDILAEMFDLDLSVIESTLNESLTETVADAVVAAEKPQPGGGATTAPAESVRIDLGLLDQVVSLVGELVLARNQMAQNVEDGKEVETQTLTHITTALQEQALRTRMQRIGSAWKSLPRAVRDVSKVAGKKARLEMVGEGIELDRTIIEAVRDPMLHLVRNAVDHGLESPEARAAAGKDETGTIRLTAIQDGGHVVVEVSDDGGGIDPEKIAAAAVSKGLVTAEQAAKLSPREKTELILAAGFSTAEAVTKISGRGVGMDVVASNIRDIRGSLEIRSELGVGTTIRLSIPLTLAIVPALMVTSGDELFAIPQASVIELVRLRPGDNERRIEYVHEAPVLRLREQLLPLIDLATILEGEPADREAATVVVLQSSDQPFGLVVDQVSKAEEIVVKPVSESVQALGCYAGATVLGDGSAALILDVSALAGTANMAAGSGSAPVADTSADDMDAPTPVLTVLLGDRSAALPTEQLERLEKIDPAAIEWSGRTPVVQYRGRLLPLVDLGSMLHHSPADQGTGPLRVVVTSEADDSSVGLIVDQVLDIVDVDLAAVDRVGADARMGVYGSVVAAGTVVDLVDVDQIASTIDNGPALIGEAAA